MMPPGNGDEAEYSAWGLIGQVGAIMLISLGAGFAIGLEVDRLLGTKPVFTLVGVTIGFALGIAAVYRVATQATRRAEAAYLKRRSQSKQGGTPAVRDDEDE